MVFVNGEPVDTGEHGETAFVFQSGAPVNNNGASDVAFEAGVGLGTNEWAFPNKIAFEPWEEVPFGPFEESHFEPWEEVPFGPFSQAYSEGWEE